MNDSKEHWLSLRRGLKKFDVQLGTATAQGYVGDPRMMAFISSRYKFVSKMLEGKPTVLEIGCGDSFGAPIVAQATGRVICTDIDEETLEDNKLRCAHFPKLAFEYYDFRQKPYPQRVDGIYLVDVIEHIYPDEESTFLRNICGSLKEDGVALFGTPNKASEQYASENSRIGHVNVKTGQALRESCSAHFRNVFMFGMNDEVVHTGFLPMAHYLWALCAGPKSG